MATDTSGDERDDELTASNDEALAADDTTSTSGATEASVAEEEALAAGDEGDIVDVSDADAAAEMADADEAEAEIDEDEAETDDADDRAEPVAVGAPATKSKKDRAAKPAAASAKKGKPTPKREKAASTKDETERKGIGQFFREVWIELKKVVTPTRRELWRYVAVVLGFLIIMMAIVTVLDFFFGFVSSWVFGNGTELFPAGPAVDPNATLAPTGAPVDPSAVATPAPAPAPAPATP